MAEESVARPSLLQGVLGGVIGGTVFAAIMVINGTLSDMGMLSLPLIGELVGHPSALVGFAVHMFNSALIGAGYVLVFGRLGKGMVDGLHYGMLYGVFWWFVGEMTLMPLLLGLEIGSQWSFVNALRLLPSLIGHLVYGAILGMTVGAFRDASLPDEPPPAAGAESEAVGEGVRPRVATGPVVAAESRPGRPPARGRAPLWVTLGTIAVVFALNVLIFAYAVFSGLPAASGPHHAVATEKSVAGGSR